MARIRTDNVFGTTANDPLTSAATTMNSAGLANLDVVASPDEALITLDPHRAGGAPEIVVVTAHTVSATSATIQRGQFGTTARQHAVGTEWVHGPIGGNATTFVTAANDQGDFIPMGAWEAYTPTNTNVTVGNGTETARFTRLGGLIHVRYQLVWGSTTSFTGTVQIGNPVSAEMTNTAAVVGGRITDSSAGTAGTTPISGFLASAGSLRPVPTTGGVITATNPFTWASGDALVVAWTCEAAS